VIAGEEGSDKVVPPVSSEEKEKEKKRGGGGLRVGSVAVGLVLLGSAQLGCLPFFFCSEPFSFSVFLFFHRFCILNSNVFKPTL
jgi:hypothetical protein